MLIKIGNAGEKAVYEYLIGKYKEKGYIQEDKEKNLNSVKLTKKSGDDFVEIKWCNSSSYRQHAYDIEIIINENKEKITKYVEVKTHTENSVLSRRIKLSYQQYCMSRGNNNYSVIVMKALFSLDEIKCELNKYFDPFYCCEGKEVIPEYREYNFEFHE